MPAIIWDYVWLIWVKNEAIIGKETVRAESAPPPRTLEWPKTPHWLGLKDITNSFHEVTHIGLEPHQFFFLFRISQHIQSLETSRVSAKMGCGWQAGWVLAKIFSSNLHRHVMNKCWKFQEDSLILVWFIAEWLKICCNQWTPNAH